MEAFISVIVTDHDRRIFLPRALQSLENQTLPKDKFEVIVIKNYEDKEIDDMIRRNGWKNIVAIDAKNLRAKVTVGVEHARGEVITFLEDDIYAQRGHRQYMMHRSMKIRIHGFA